MFRTHLSSPLVGTIRFSSKSSGPAEHLISFSRLAPPKHSISRPYLLHVVLLLLRWAFEAIFGVDVGLVEMAMYNIGDCNGSSGTKNDEEDNKRGIELTAIQDCTHRGKSMAESMKIFVSWGVGLQQTGGIRAAQNGYNKLLGLYSE